MSADLMLAIEAHQLKKVQNYFANHPSQVNCYLPDDTTPLTFATRNGNLEIVEHILLKGADINKTEASGCTPLLLATYLGNFKVVRLLIANGANINVTDPYGNTPLANAVREEHLTIVDYLLKKGAHVNTVNKSGWSPFSWAVKENKLKIVKRLLSSKKVTQNEKNPLGNTPLVSAVQRGYADIVRCLANPTEIDEIVNEGKTLLALAAAKGHLNVVHTLVEQGADFNKVSKDGNTPLATAVAHKHLDIVIFLTDAGATVCKVYGSGRTPLSWAVRNEDIDMVRWLLAHGAEYTIQTAFLEAIETENLEIVQVLRENGAIVNMVHKCYEADCEVTPLMKALDVGNVGIAKYLIENGAKVVGDLNDEDTCYVIEFIREDNLEMVKLLVQNGARINGYDEDGNTPLTMAVDMEKFEMVEYLVKNGADVNYFNYDELTPIMSAALNCDFRTFEFLVEAGAELCLEKMIVDKVVSKEFFTYIQSLKHQVIEERMVVGSGCCQKEATNDD